MRVKIAEKKGFQGQRSKVKVMSRKLYLSQTVLLVQC